MQAQSKTTLKVDGSNYAYWKIIVKAALMSAKLEYVAVAVNKIPDGYDEKKALTATEKPAKERVGDENTFAKYLRANAMAKSIILDHLDQSLRDRYLGEQHILDKLDAPFKIRTSLSAKSWTAKMAL